jgi:hypothetical protein
LSFAAVEDSEIRGLQAADVIPLAIDDDHVHLDELDARPKAWLLWMCRPRRE